jgi:hypothetical protein
VKFIKFILCLSIILIAYPAASEIYKYVDENGDIHFTDDFSKVPVEQRSAINAGLEYENDTDAEQVAETEVSGGTYEGVTDDSAEEFTDDSEYQDEVYDSADTADEEQIVALGEDPENETDLMASSSDDAETENDLDAIRSQLEVMKKEIDGEYQDLVKEKEQLAKEKKSLKGQEDITKHNKKVKHLDKKIETYAKKGKLYETRVEAYNEWVRQENTKLKKKTETP